MPEGDTKVILTQLLQVEYMRNLNIILSHWINDVNSCKSRWKKVSLRPKATVFWSSDVVTMP